MKFALRFIGILLIITSCNQNITIDNDWLSGVQKWQLERNKNLSKEDGWLSLCGLIWLDSSGDFGQNSSCRYQIKENGFPDIAGKIVIANDSVSFIYFNNISKKLLLYPAQNDTKAYSDDSIFSWQIIERDGRLGLRVRNKKNKVLNEFKTMHFYPINSDYLLHATWIPFSKADTITVATSAKNIFENQVIIGKVHFKIKMNKNEPIEAYLTAFEAEDKLFFVFKDATSGSETYQAGRFLYTDKPVNGKVVLDFNKAYTPPCAFTPFATCPLAPKENHLPFAITAGEIFIHK